MDRLLPSRGVAPHKTTPRTTVGQSRTCGMQKLFVETPDREASRLDRPGDRWLVFRARNRCGSRSSMELQTNFRNERAVLEHFSGRSTSRLSRAAHGVLQPVFLEDRDLAVFADRLGKSVRLEIFAELRARHVCPPIHYAAACRHVFVTRQLSALLDSLLRLSEEPADEAAHSTGGFAARRTNPKSVS